MAAVKRPVTRISPTSCAAFTIPAKPSARHANAAPRTPFWLQKHQTEL